MSEKHEAKRVVPYLTFYGRGREAIELWSRAFGAEQMEAYPENGQLRHAEVKINGGFVFVTDLSMDKEPLPAFQSTPSIALHLEVPDGSDWMARGKAAGCSVLTPWQNQSFGGFGRLLDPFGVIWSIASPKQRVGSKTSA
jgi:PhnB protein